MDTLANALNNIKVSEVKGQPGAKIKPTSRVIREVLTVLQNNGYLEGFEFHDDAQGGFITVKLKGRINECGIVKPRFSVTKETWEKFEQRFLPSKDTGILIVSTSKGIMTHNEAKQQNVGGRLIAYAF